MGHTNLALTRTPPAIVSNRDQSLPTFESKIVQGSTLNIKPSPIKVLTGEIALSSTYGLVIYAMSFGAMAMVSSLRETSVIFAALIGSLVFKESFGKQRIIAAVFVSIGIIEIKITAWEFVGLR